MNRLELALAAALTALDRAKLGFAIVGGLAVSARAEPRFTRDVDIAVAVDSDRVAERLVGKLTAQGYAILAQVEHEPTGRLATVRLASPTETGDQLVVDLLFASCGIEREIAVAAQVLRLTPTLEAPVATTGHLIAMKLLSRDDQSRPQDRADLVALIGTASREDLADCRDAVRLIEARGFARGRMLQVDLDQLLESVADDR